MGNETGIASMINYAGAANDQARVQLLLDALPNPSTTSSSGAKQADTYVGFLDEMSPIALTQLRVELTALKAAVS